MTFSPPLSRSAAVAAADEDKKLRQDVSTFTQGALSRLNLHILLRSTDAELSLCRQRLGNRCTALWDADRRWSADVGEGQLHRHLHLESSWSSGLPAVRGTAGGRQSSEKDRFTDTYAYTLNQVGVADFRRSAVVTGDLKIVTKTARITNFRFVSVFIQLEC